MDANKTRHRYTEGHLQLKRYVRTDLEERHRAVLESAHLVAPWLGWCHEGYSAEENEAWFRRTRRGWKRGTRFVFMIRDIERNEMVGEAMINHINKTHKVGNIAYWIRNGCTGRGFATTATLLTARFGFQEVGLRRLEIFVSPNNKASLRVAEKVGATFEGIMRNRIYHHGISEDAMMFSLIPEDIL